MSPEQRREIVDNLAGLSEFSEKKEESMRELSKVETRIREAGIVLNERATFLSELEAEMKAAEEFGVLEKEKRQVKATIIEKEISSIEKNDSELGKQISGLENEIAENEKAEESDKAELDKIKKQSSELGSKMLKAAEEIYSKHGKALEEKKGQLQLEKEKIEMKQELASRNSEKISKNKTELSALLSEKAQLQQKKKDFEQKISETSRELKILSEERAKIEGIVKAKSSELAKRENKADESNKKIEEFRKQVFDLEVAAKQWEKQKSFNEKKLSELAVEEKEISEELEIINQKKRKIKEYAAGRNLEHALAEAEKEIENLLQEKNKKMSLAEQERKNIENLKKSASNCPVCDSSLNEEKKSMLIAAKNKAALEAEAAAKKINEREIEEKKKLAALKEKIALIARLSAETSHEAGVLTRIEEVRKKIVSVKKELDKKELDEKVRERNKLNEKIKSLLLELEQTKEGLKAFRSQNIFENFTNIAKRFEELQQKKNSFDAQLGEASSRLENAVLPNERVLERENSLLENENKEIEDKISLQKKLLEKIAEEINEKESEMDESKEKTGSLAKEKDALEKQSDKIEKHVSELFARAKKIAARMNELKIEKSRNDVRLGDLKEEQKEFEGTEILFEKNVDELKKRLPVIEERIAEIGAVNLKAMNNFNQMQKDVEDIRGKAKKLEDERLAVLDMIDKIEVKRTSIFMACFNEINKNFEEMFFKFFGGEGKLSLSDEANPLESGLMIDAKHKGEKLQNIDSMSGGEKTLTALAFMFAIQFYKPAPFYAFDEADAALDKENSLKVSSLIEMVSEKSQFIAITHNDPIIKKADQVVGVALTKDKSSVIGLRLKNPSKQQNQNQEE
jgi:chromosome segregation protein